jgi:hypothetical protein
VGPRTGLDDVESRKFLTLPGLELQTLRRPASRYTELSRLQLFVVHVLKSSHRLLRYEAGISMLKSGFSSLIFSTLHAL